MNIPAEKCATYEEIMAQSKDLLVIDVRSQAEIDASGKIPGGRWLNIPIAEISDAFSMSEHGFKSKYGTARPGKDDPNLLFNCGSGRRSGMALEAVGELGFSKARHFAGGYGKWPKSQAAQSCS